MESSDALYPIKEDLEKFAERVLVLKWTFKENFRVIREIISSKWTRQSRILTALSQEIIQI